jgi:hypothetical protein
MHDLPPPHAAPHAPQCALSDAMSTHAPLHGISAPQSSTHWPPTQMSPSAQAWLQLPQWLRSSLSDAHSVPVVPAQSVPVQAAHAPPTQDWSGKQALPHSPQSVALCKLTHCPPQNPRPTPHTSWHALAWQTAPGAHATPHAPQCIAFVLTSTQPKPQTCSVGKHAPD